MSEREAGVPAHGRHCADDGVFVNRGRGSRRRPGGYDADTRDILRIVDGRRELTALFEGA